MQESNPFSRNLHLEAIYESWFSIADGDGDGKISGHEAVTFFGRSKLTRQELRQIWKVSDRNNAGWLSKEDFQIALRLIALCQQGPELLGNNIWTGNVEDDITLSKLALAEGQGLHEQGRYLRPPSLEGLDHTTSTGQQKLILQTRHGATRARRPEIIESLVGGLKVIYNEKVKPVEEAYNFGQFYSPVWTDGDFDAQPTVLLLGQYSTGKTTFIKHLLGREAPGMHIGPEPTTDKFMAVLHGREERVIPGNALSMQTDRPFTALNRFGTQFLTKLVGSELPHPLLKQITLVDTPGVLSGEKQRTERGYDFVGCCEWFAQKSDMILLLFDPYKLDISDEFKRVIVALRRHSDKVRVILNKADQVDNQQLMRVYGALMWSLGKVMGTPEVVRVHLGSFNEKPISDGVENKQLFELEQNDLVRDLQELPRSGAMRKINEMVKRIRAAKVHACIMNHIRGEMPTMWGKEAVTQKVLDNIKDVFVQVQRQFNLPAGDFPDPAKFKEMCQGIDFTRFPKLKDSALAKLNETLSSDIPQILSHFHA